MCRNARANYQNFYYSEINEWMIENNYTAIKRSESDTLYLKGD